MELTRLSGLPLLLALSSSKPAPTVAWTSTHTPTLQEKRYSIAPARISVTLERSWLVLALQQPPLAGFTSLTMARALIATAGAKALRQPSLMTLGLLTVMRIPQ